MDLAIVPAGLPITGVQIIKVVPLTSRPVQAAPVLLTGQVPVVPVVARATGHHQVVQAVPVTVQGAAGVLLTGQAGAVQEAAGAAVVPAAVVPAVAAGVAAAVEAVEEAPPVEGGKDCFSIIY